jgi:redox-sensing transcriptional repressor
MSSTLSTGIRARSGVRADEPHPLAGARHPLACGALLGGVTVATMRGGSSGNDSGSRVSTDQQDQRVVPHGVVERLPSYLNVLLHLRKEGCHTVSSVRLSGLADVNAAQIRRDLAHFGQFGKRGVGYDICMLVSEIQNILGSDNVQEIVIVGAGNLCSALACYEGLRIRGFTVAAVFDSDPARIGEHVGGLVVRDVEELEQVVTERIHVGVIAVRADAAQAVADRLCKAGIRAIVNYSTAFVDVPADVALHNADPLKELLHTLYNLSRAESMAGA